MNTRKIVTFATSLLLLNLLAACAASTPQPPGVVTGQVMYKALTNDGSAEPMPDVMVALCQVPAKGLPEGPIVASSNRDETEQVCTLQGAPTALTDADGTFTLEVYPPPPTW